jgi:hypothetical protein
MEICCDITNHFIDVTLQRVGIDVRSEVLIVTPVLWDVTPCSLVPN